MEDANISVQKVIVSTDINISAPPLEILDTFLPISFQVIHFVYCKFYDKWWSIYYRSGRMSFAVLHNTECTDLPKFSPNQ
jgi:hypothetical protein